MTLCEGMAMDGQGCSGCSLSMRQYAEDFVRVTLPNLIYGFDNRQLVNVVRSVTPDATPVATPVMTPVAL